MNRFRENPSVMPVSGRGAALVVFDVDGTLFEADRVTPEAVRVVLTRHGIPDPGYDAVRRYLGRPVAEYERWVMSLCPPDRARQILEETNTAELELIATAGRLYPGVPEMLASLRAAGHVMAVCSNGPERYVARFLDSHGVRPFMAAVQARDSRAVTKADMAAELLALFPDYRPAFFVGDRADDMAAARANGMIAVGVGYGGFGGERELADAVHVLRDPRDLPALVARYLRDGMPAN